jgi:hypothetical protein
MEPANTFFTSRRGLSAFFGVKPMSCISRNAKTNVSASTMTRMTYGTARFVA